MELSLFFKEYPEVAIAFSGGVDSAYLLYAAKKYAKRCCAYYVKTAFQPEFELKDAIKLVKEIDAELKIIEADILQFKEVTDNPGNRCYYCKKQIFDKIISSAAEDGYKVILDGTNASDDADDRPGMKALAELKVLSPLRICGITKDEIRRLSREAGLFTADKPAYACLATRIPAGEVITAEKLSAIEKAEDFLFKEGFTDFRVRTVEGHARIEVPDAQWMKLASSRDRIYEGLKGLFKTVSVSLKSR